MPQSPNAIEQKVTKFITAWRELAATRKLADMTLDEFVAKVKPSIDARTEVNRLETLLADAINQRADADRESLRLCNLVVNSVKGTPGLGEDSPLYEAMGYVRKSERKSGLSRGRRATGTTEPKPTA